MAAPIFRDVMAAALQGSPPVPFRAPPGVALVRMQLENGQTLLEAFRPGTEYAARPPVDPSPAAAPAPAPAAVARPRGWIRGWAGCTDRARGPRRRRCCRAFRDGPCAVAPRGVSGYPAAPMRADAENLKTEIADGVALLRAPSRLGCRRACGSRS